MVATTRVSKGFQTVVPASLRRRFGLGPGDEVVWTVVGDEVYVRVRKVGGEDPLKALIGALPTAGECDATAELDEAVYGSE